MELDNPGLVQGTRMDQESRWTFGELGNWLSSSLRGTVLSYCGPGSLNWHNRLIKPAREVLILIRDNQGININMSNIGHTGGVNRT